MKENTIRFVIDFKRKIFDKYKDWSISGEIKINSKPSLDDSKEQIVKYELLITIKTKTSISYNRELNTVNKYENKIHCNNNYYDYLSVIKNGVNEVLEQLFREAYFNYLQYEDCVNDAVSLIQILSSLKGQINKEISEVKLFFAESFSDYTTEYFT